MLEVPPLMPASPGYRVVKCSFFAKGECHLGSACTYAHDLSAPMALADTSKEDAWRKRSVMMTHDQMYVFKERESWGQTVGPMQFQGKGFRPPSMATGSGHNQALGPGGSWPNMG